MTSGVIQGTFLGGRPKLAMPAPQPAAMPGPPPPAHVAQPRMAQALGAAVPKALPPAMPRQPGPPPPAHVARPRAPQAQPRSAQPQAAGGAIAVDPALLRASGRPGQPLPDAVQRKMEQAFGADFSSVRVHEGPQAESIGAIAFTVGSDIYFAPGRFQPHTAAGQQLLGHELTHVLQQRAGRVRNPLGSGLAVVQDHALEAEADRLGQRAAAQMMPASAVAQTKVSPAARQSKGRLLQVSLPPVPPQVQSDLPTASRDWRPLAAHVRAAVSAVGQPKMANFRSGARPLASHLRAAVAAVGNYTATLQCSIVLIGGKSIETKNRTLKELQALKRFYPEVAKGINAAIKKGEFKNTRSRHPHSESDGESDEDRPILDDEDRSYFRALRPEEQPHITGIQPPDGCNWEVSARAHVAAGTRSKVKSPFLSGSFSQRVAGVWAANEGDPKRQRVVEFQVPSGFLMYDLTTKMDQTAIELTGTGLNAAKASQEIIVRGGRPGNGEGVPQGIPPEYVRRIYKVRKISGKKYLKLKRSAGLQKTRLPRNGKVFFRTRRKQKEKVTPFTMKIVYDRERESARRLAKARQAWDRSVQEALRGAEVSQMQLDAEDMASHLQGTGIDNPYELDYISNDEELQIYLRELELACRLAKGGVPLG